MPGVQNIKAAVGEDDLLAEPTALIQMRLNLAGCHDLAGMSRTSQGMMQQILNDLFPADGGHT